MVGEIRSRHEFTILRLCKSLVGLQGMLSLPDSVQFIAHETFSTYTRDLSIDSSDQKAVVLCSILTVFVCVGYKFGVEIPLCILKSTSILKISSSLLL
jgi:hypothetical protein